MAVLEQVLTDQYAIYNGDSAEMLASLPSESIGLAIYSPPFATENGGCLYNYSSSVRDLSNARTYAEFFDQYSYIVEHVARVLKPGRISAVHRWCVTGTPISGRLDEIRGLCEFLDLQPFHARTTWAALLERPFEGRAAAGLRAMRALLQVRGGGRAQR